MHIFRAFKGQLLEESMSSAGCQKKPIDVNFHLKSLEIFGKNQLTKSDPTWTKGWKCPPPHPMPNRVKHQKDLHINNLQMLKISVKLSVYFKVQKNFEYCWKQENRKHSPTKCATLQSQFSDIKFSDHFSINYIRFSDIMRFSDSFCGDQMCH